LKILREKALLIIREKDNKFPSDRILIYT